MSIASLLILYMTRGIYIGYRKDGDKDVEGHLKPGMSILMLLGAVMLALGLYGEFVWPLPGAYNIRFYDMYTLVAIVIIAFAVTIRFSYKMQYVGLFCTLFRYNGHSLWIQGLSAGNS
jgi:putative membrane protein